MYEDDAETLKKETGKLSMMRWAGQEETISLPFRRERDGILTPYLLQTIQTRESDNHHIVIGVRPE